jgi:hypothetical protein
MAYDRECDESSELSLRWPERRAQAGMLPAAQPRPPPVGLVVRACEHGRPLISPRDGAARPPPRAGARAAVPPPVVPPPVVPPPAVPPTTTAPAVVAPAAVEAVPTVPPVTAVEVPPETAVEVPPEGGVLPPVVPDVPVLVVVLVAVLVERVLAVDVLAILERERLVKLNKQLDAKTNLQKSDTQKSDNKDMASRLLILGDFRVSFLSRILQNLGFGCSPP